MLRNKHLAQGLQIAATPFGCGDDRVFVLWTTRADVTLLEKGCGKVEVRPAVWVTRTPELVERPVNSRISEEVLIAGGSETFAGTLDDKAADEA